MALIPFTFPQSYRALPPQQPAGGDVSALLPLRSSVALRDAGSDTELRDMTDSRAASEERPCAGIRVYFAADGSGCFCSKAATKRAAASRTNCQSGSSMTVRGSG